MGKSQKLRGGDVISILTSADMTGSVEGARNRKVEGRKKVNYAGMNSVKPQCASKNRRRGGELSVWRSADLKRRFVGFLFHRQVKT